MRFGTRISSREPCRRSAGELCDWLWLGACPEASRQGPLRDQSGRPSLDAATRRTASASGIDASSVGSHRRSPGHGETLRYIETACLPGDALPRLRDGARRSPIVDALLLVPRDAHRCGRATCLACYSTAAAEPRRGAGPPAGSGATPGLGEAEATPLLRASRTSRARILRRAPAALSAERAVRAALFPRAEAKRVASCARAHALTPGAGPRVQRAVQAARRRTRAGSGRSAVRGPARILMRGRCPPDSLQRGEARPCPRSSEGPGSACGPGAASTRTCAWSSPFTDSVHLQPQCGESGARRAGVRRQPRRQPTPTREVRVYYGYDPGGAQLPVGGGSATTRACWVAVAPTRSSARWCTRPSRAQQPGREAPAPG